MSKEPARAHAILFLNTLAFTVCFASWMLNGVLVTFLVSNQIFDWSASQMGWLIGIPVLTGSLVRLPLGMLTDRFGGRPVYTLLMLVAAVPMFFLGRADTYTEFMLLSLGFGLTGGAFAVGIAFTSVWYHQEHQGTALGVFGAGNAGAALTTLGAPSILASLTDGGANLEGWRALPTYYAAALVVMAAVFFLGTQNRKPEGSGSKTMRVLLAPLKNIRVWRFGLYYFLVFGGFVALAQWLVPYYVNVYAMSIVTAGLMTSIFSLPSGVIRALGGWFSDIFGARRVLYWVLGVTGTCSFLLIFPKMDIESPGRGVLAQVPGTVTAVTPTGITVGRRTYPLAQPQETSYGGDEAFMLWPDIRSWQEPVVREGDRWCGPNSWPPGSPMSTSRPMFGSSPDSSSSSESQWGSGRRRSTSTSRTTSPTMSVWWAGSWAFSGGSAGSSAPSSSGLFSTHSDSGRRPGCSCFW